MVKAPIHVHTTVSSSTADTTRDKSHPGRSCIDIICDFDFGPFIVGQINRLVKPSKLVFDEFESNFFMMT